MIIFVVFTSKVTYEHMGAVPTVSGTAPPRRIKWARGGLKKSNNPADDICARSAGQILSLHIRAA